MIEADAEERKITEWQEHKGEKVKAAASENFMSQHISLKSQRDTATERSIPLTMTVRSVYPN